MRSFAITNPHRIRKLDPNVLLIVGAGLLLGLPCLLYGFPFYGDDSVQHAIYYTHFVDHLGQGDPYPRWLQEMNSGLGSPAFFYYPPIPYYLTSILRAVFRSDTHGWAQLGISSVVALIASGVTLFIWLKPHAGGRPALVAAIVYMALPYHLNLDLYSRGAFAELWTFVWMPLVLRSLDRVVERRRFALLGLSLSYALLAMTHLPTTLIFSLVPLAYSLFQSEFQSEAGQRSRVLGVTVGGMLLGAGLSAIYLIPALALQRFSFLSEATAGHYYYANWFLFTDVTWSSKSDFFWFTLEVAVLPCLAFAVTMYRGARPLKKHAAFWLLTVLVSFWMMSPLSKPIWSTFTTLQKVQFPWRFNTIVSLAAAALVALALGSVNSWSMPAVMLKAALVLLLGIWIYDAGRRAWEAYPIHYVDQAVVNFRNKWLEQNRDQNEYRPRWVVSIREKDLEALLTRIGKTPALPGVAKLSPAGTVAIRSWTSKGIALEIDSLEGGVLTVSQFYFPGWQALMDGARDLEVSPSIPGGLASMRVPGGKHRISLERVKTAPESAGQIISAIALALLLIVTVRGAFFSISGSNQQVAKMAVARNHRTEER